jgi:hypothetical protein
MSAILAALLFVVGFAWGLVVVAKKSSAGVCSPKPPLSEKLDSTDEMVLYGEVTGDDFYDIM